VHAVVIACGHSDAISNSHPREKPKGGSGRTDDGGTICAGILPNIHHDALDFPDGYVILLTRLAQGALVLCSTQFPDGVRNMLAQTLGLSVERVRVRYYEGAGVFGRACHDDSALAAAVMSQVVGRPVRVQFMRWDELGWDNYGPAHLADVRAGCDAEGRITAFEYHGWHHGWNTTETSQELALGGPVQPPVSGGARLVNKETLNAPAAHGGGALRCDGPLANHRLGDSGHRRCAGCARERGACRLCDLPRATLEAPWRGQGTVIGML
jgi:hypothetical protein